MYNDKNKIFVKYIDENLSKRIKSIRFLLIVLVVFIHNNPTEVYFSTGVVVYTIPAYVTLVRELISNIIARAAVPLFFLISGYLLFVKEEKYTAVIKKKCKTILLPYIIWNILAVFFYFVAQSLNFSKSYFTNNILRDFQLLDWIDVFVGKFTAVREYQYPLVYQFWFLRDLFILNLLFFAIKAIINRFPFGTITLFLVLWLGDANIRIVSSEALLFFSLGYYIVKYSLNYRILDDIKIYDIAFIYLLTACGELLIAERLPIIHKINIIIGGILLIKMTKYFIASEKLYSMLNWLEGYAFFVYAAHGILLAVILKLYVRILPMHDGWLLLQYFSVSFIGIALSLAVGIIIKKLVPKMYGILTGERIQK